jgi:hypothetical protein
MNGRGSAAQDSAIAPLDITRSKSITCTHSAQNNRKRLKTLLRKAPTGMGSGSCVLLAMTASFLSFRGSDSPMPIFRWKMASERFTSSPARRSLPAGFIPGDAIKVVFAGLITSGLAKSGRPHYSADLSSFLIRRAFQGVPAITAIQFSAQCDQICR